ncbi:hypothetical protein DHEL01_v212954 [Diaporthe helianthi]|uniref:DUF1776-domain-containing protein n=1 Tax=Diaporthe helianthi TaxID=158607 RepID=A0A2P5HEH6_DIAHE|nr:hypothetical protein DHEL01_v212954 [Diaporthe helianthi]
MSADDQQFLDMSLSSIPNHVKQYSSEVADVIDRHVEKLAEQFRDTLSTKDWIPDVVRPRGRPQPPHTVHPIPSSAYERVQEWVHRHKLLTGFVALTVGVLVYRGFKKGKHSRKTRRARRARNGGRLEVVVVAGDPKLPMTRSLSLDLERRGFIVYIACNTLEDEAVVQKMSRPDVRPLGIDVTDPPSAGASIDRFATYLQTPHAAVPGAKQNYLSLRSVILIPSLNYQTSPIATIPPSNFADLFNTHLLYPILTIQAFLPLLTAKLTSSGAERHPPKVIVFTPAIMSSINPPFHAPEATVCSALSAFTEVLAGELRPLAVPVTHVQLGTFDFSGFTPSAMRSHQPSGLLTAPPAETLTWPDAARKTYGRNFVNTSASAISAGRVRGMRGSSLRDLHNVVFDVIDGSNTSNVVRVGLGADLYGFVGRWVPRHLVQWMMGHRKVNELSSWQGSHQPSPKLGSESGDGSSRSGSDFQYVSMS